MPKIVVFIDELAGPRDGSQHEVESAIIRLAQMARAAGIHMIIATQRPSVGCHYWDYQGQCAVPFGLLLPSIDSRPF